MIKITKFIVQLKSNKMARINAVTKRTLKNFGIIANTEKEAHEKLVAALKEEGIEMEYEYESLAALIDMADGLLGNDESEEDEYI